MSESAVVLEIRQRSAKQGENVHVRRFRGQHQRESGQTALAVQARATEASSGKEMGEWFQKHYLVGRDILAATAIDKLAKVLVPLGRYTILPAWLDERMSCLPQLAASQRAELWLTFLQT